MADRLRVLALRLIKAELAREKQGAALKAKLAGLAKSSGGSLDAIVAKDPSLRKITSNEIRWRDGSIDGYGVDPRQVFPQLMKVKQEQFLSEYLQSYRRNSKIEDFR